MPVRAAHLCRSLPVVAWATAAILASSVAGPVHATDAPLGIVLTSTAPAIAVGQPVAADDILTIPVGASVALATGDQGRILWLHGLFRGVVPAVEPLMPSLSDRLVKAVSARSRQRATGVFRRLTLPGDTAAPASPPEPMPAQHADVDSGPTGPWVIDIAVPHDAVCLAEDGRSILRLDRLPGLQRLYVETEAGEKTNIEPTGPVSASVGPDLLRKAANLLVFFVSQAEYFWEAPIRRIPARPDEAVGAILADFAEAGCGVQTAALLDRLAAAAAAKPDLSQEPAPDSRPAE